MARTKVFISYSRKDEFWKQILVSHLSVLEAEGLVHLWSDSRIATGENWQRRIDEALRDAKIIIFMITANFLASEFIREKEVKPIMQNHKTQGMQILPLIVRPCSWKLIDWVETRQVRPKYGRPLSAGDDVRIDAELAALSYEIAALIGRAGSELAEDEIERADQLAERSNSRYLPSSPSVGTGDVVGAKLMDMAISKLSLLFRQADHQRAVVSDTFIRSVLQEAITHGAPIYDAGSPLGCAIIYNFAGELLLQCLNSSPELPSRAALARQAVRVLSSKIRPFAPANYEHADEVAWTLREAFDEILSQ